MSYRFQYDDANRLARWIDGEGRAASYSYDAHGRVTTVRYEHGNVLLRYDAEGDLVELSDGNGRSEYLRDPFGRLTQVDFHYSPGRGVAYEYDPWGRISVVRMLLGPQTQLHALYEYDVLGNLLAVRGDFGRVTYSHDPERRETVRRLPNGITSTFTFSPAGELARVEHRGTRDQVLSRYSYRHDVAGNVVRAEEAKGGEKRVWECQWDSRGRLASLQKPDGGTVEYQYDGVGNRVSRSEGGSVLRYTYDSYDRLTASGTDLYGYDGAGHVTTATEAGGQSTYTWDTEGRLLEARLPGHSTRYQYDGLGNMVSRWQDSQVTHYLPNPAAPSGFHLAEIDGTGNVQAAYLYGDTLLGRRDDSGRMLYFLEDGFSSIRDVVDERGAPVGGRDYSPFGEMTHSWGEQGGSFRMAGEWRDPLTGHSFVGNRAYDGSLGRLLAPDVAAYVRGSGRGGPQAHDGNGYVMSAQPRLNQTHGHSADFWMTRVPQGAYLALGQMQHVLAEAGAYGLPFNVEGVGDLAALAGQQLGNPGAVSWDDLERASRNTLGDMSIGVLPLDLQGVGDLAALAGRQLGDPGSVSWDDLEVASRNTLGEIGEATAHLSRFYGGRMDRPYWWWSPMKWVSESHYQQLRQEEMGVRARAGGGAPVDHLGPGGAMFSPFEGPCPGGIDLEVAAQFSGHIGKITGAVFDSATEQIVLVGDADVSLPAVDPHDMAVALQCLSSPQTPVFSLDPADPQNPTGPWLQCRYEGPIRNTAFGLAMFEADWLLKTYSFGLDLEGNELHSNVPEFRSIFDLSFAQDNAGESPTWMRYWITCEEAILERRGNAVYLDDVRMKVNTENMYVAAHGLQAAHGVQDPLAKRFADHFTARYSEFGREQPAFARVKQLARVMALADWLRDLGVELDLSWVREEADTEVKTPDQVSTLSDSRVRKTETPVPGGVQIEQQTVYLTGGVDLRVTPALRDGGARVARLAESVGRALESESTTPVLNFSSDGRELLGLVLPFTPRGRSRWESGDTTDANGTTYRRDASRRVTGYTRADGTKAQLGYAADGACTSLTLSSPAGWEAEGSASGKGSRMSVTSPRGDRFDSAWDPTGHLTTVTANGDVALTVTHDLPGRKRTLSFADHTEAVTYDAAGHTTSQTIRPKSADGAGTRGGITLTYGGEGRPTSLTTDLGERISLRYQGGRVTEVSRGKRRLKLTYETDGRIRNAVSGQDAIEWEYVDGGLRSVRVRRGKVTTTSLFDNGRPVRTQDLLRNTTEYRYEPNGITKITHPDGSVSYIERDASGRVIRRTQPTRRSILYSLDGDQLKAIDVPASDRDGFVRRPPWTEGWETATLPRGVTFDSGMSGADSWVPRAGQASGLTAAAELAAGWHGNSAWPSVNQTRVVHFMSVDAPTISLSAESCVSEATGPPSVDNADPSISFTRPAVLSAICPEAADRLAA